MAAALDPDVEALLARCDLIVDAIFGTYSSAVALAIQEIIHEHKVLHFAATSNSCRVPAILLSSQPVAPSPTWHSTH